MANTDSKNLMMIQRIDVCAEAILDKATHTALYNFNANTRQWEKTEVDGAMFIYKRADHPEYSLMIANRQSPEDLVEPITAKIRIKLDKPYLFFCKEDNSIRGLWFYQHTDCERIYLLLDKLIRELRTEQAVAQTASSSERGLLTMLMGTSPAAAPVVPVAKSSSPPPPEPPIPRQPYQQPTANVLTSLPQSSETLPGRVPPMLKMLMAEGNEANKISPKPIPASISAADLERDLVRGATAAGAIPSSAMAGIPAALLSAGRADFSAFMNPSISAASLAAASIQSVHGSDGNDAADLESMMSGIRLENLRGDGRRGTDSRGSVGGGGGTSTAPAPPLDQQQLLAAMTFLLQNDDEFLAKVHQAYVDALNRRFSI